MYKKMKVFDVHEGMPEHIRDAVAQQYEIKCNGCYFKHEVMDKTFTYENDDGIEVTEENEEYSELDNWLANVAGCHIGEYVLILYWW